MLSLKKVVTSVSNKITSITHLFTILAVFVGILLFSYDVHYFLSFRGSWGDYLNNIIVEAHGLLFDLVVLGILISIYERRIQQRDAIERDKNLIHDYRRWEEQEATYRIVGAIRRLNKENVSQVSLYCCFLKNAQLMALNLTEADFFLTNLISANLSSTNLTRATFSGTNLTKANLTKANLTMAKMIQANFTDANLTDANLTDATFMGVNLTGANLNGAHVNEGWFEKLDSWNVKGREKIKEQYVLDKNGKLQLK